MRTPIDPTLFRRQRFSGNPPAAPYRYGWIIRLGGRATKPEHQWLKLHGYQFSGGKWCRADDRA